VPTELAGGAGAGTTEPEAERAAKLSARRAEIAANVAKAIAERDDQTTLSDRDGDVDACVRHLGTIGLDNVRGALAGGFESWRDAGRELRHSGVITPRALNQLGNKAQVLDVREADEFDSGHIPNAKHCFVGYLPDQIDELSLDRSRPVVVTCGVGHRAGVGVSVLLRAGFRDVRNLLGGMTAWKALDLPLA